MGNSSSKLPEVNTRKPKNGIPTKVNMTFKQIYTGTEFQLEFPPANPWSARWLKLYPGMLQFCEGTMRGDPMVLAAYPAEDNDYAIQLPPRKGDKRAFLRVQNTSSGMVYLVEYTTETGEKYTFEWLRYHDAKDGSWRLKQSIPAYGQSEYSQESVAKWIPGDQFKGELGYFEMCGDGQDGKFGEYFPLVAMATVLTIECTNNKNLCNQGRSTDSSADGTSYYGSAGGMS